ncbi:glycosyltransferase family 2 protein [Bacillus atrophaeus]|uniref:glycosyltransferase family 2 protein n=1 Tax=Bacillus atrophaeus TaxID=1452 RepID=UPI002280295F|nr:glycosyltransferase family 2 protein [Bacillus atrophaeus]MCY8823830.1 glycosyltransferase family 2 protein [Bacillus atrophaeus]MCY8841078.1 glycosyltransferase family 2 protein [Bacillus atrophaeus]MEC0805333.1 glycosyltransferase family 2 protein [Bacillus atrophaeus]MEC0853249.1 glycosyltransferase family 2 protein [Bacillus atrophaeus]MEC0856376.1 glycosyltransferase family 2 protein [Bacillus atrophaeus]
MIQPPPLLTIVVPCYNEEEVFEETSRQLTSVLNSLTAEKLISEESKILFVDDGSRDRTWSLIAMESVKNSKVTGLKLACNVGHQKALLAGLHKAKHRSDCVISIDADLQDDISVIREFILKFHEGCEIVYGVRRSRKTDTFFKRTTALGFYRLMNKLGIQLIYNHADFRLMNKRSLEELGRYPEANLFLRGIVPMIGFRSAKVMYDRKERVAGETKYPLKKMLSFAFNGITSFSVAPIRFFTLIGFLLFLLSAMAGIGVIIQKMLGYTNAGWASLIISIWFLGGLQLMGIGIIGEYIGTIFTEVKRRPKYAIDIDLYSEPLSPLQRQETERLLEKKYS